MMSPRRKKQGFCTLAVKPTSRPEQTRAWLEMRFALPTVLCCVLVANLREGFGSMLGRCSQFTINTSNFHHIWVFFSSAIRRNISIDRSIDSSTDFFLFSWVGSVGARRCRSDPFDFCLRMDFLLAWSFLWLWVGSLGVLFIMFSKNVPPNALTGVPKFCWLCPQGIGSFQSMCPPNVGNQGMLTYGTPPFLGYLQIHELIQFNFKSNFISITHN